MEFVIFVDGNVLFDQAFDVAEQANVTRFTERNCNPFGRTTTGTTDTVNIAVGILRKVIVHNVGNPRNVNTTGRNIGCDQNRELAITEIAQDFLTDALLFITMDGIAINAFIAQLERQFVSVCLGFGEDQNAFGVITFKDLNQKLGLVVTFHEHTNLGHTFGDTCLR